MGIDVELDTHKDQNTTNNRVAAMRQKVGMGEVKRNATVSASPTTHNDANSDNTVIDISIDKLVPNPYQPRLSMDDEKLYELAASIKEHGILQPIVVSPLDNGMFMIHFGHRRVEGSKKAGKNTIRAIVRNKEDEVQNLIAQSLIENLQRDDMNIIDTALAYQRAIQSGVYKSLRELAKSIGKDSSDVSRTVNILSLPQNILDDIVKNKSIVDRVILDNLRKVEDVEKCQFFYNWYVDEKPSREIFIQKLKEYWSGVTTKKSDYTFKNTPKGCSIKMSSLTDKQESELKDFIDKLLATN